MLPVVVYIVGCFVAGLSLDVCRARHLPWMLLATGTLLCAWFLVAGEMTLPGLSLFSVASGAPSATGRALPVRDPIPGLNAPRSTPPRSDRRRRATVAVASLIATMTRQKLAYWFFWLVFAASIPLAVYVGFLRWQLGLGWVASPLP